MINFNSQKDFEDAVMNVLAERLEVTVYVHNKNAGPVKVEVVLLDTGVMDGCISFDMDEE